MNVLSIIGSPRRDSCSAALAAAVCSGLRQRGATITIVRLAALAYHGCIACLACKRTSALCVVQDGLTDVLAAVRACDVLVLSTPVYFGDVTAQMKGFIDRTFSFLVPDFHENPGKSRLAAGKKLVFVQTQGSPDQDTFADVFPRYEYFLKWYGFDPLMLLRVCGPDDAGTVVQRAGVQQRIDEIVAAL